MTATTTQRIVFCLMLTLAGWGCEKFDRSKIKMPKFHFATSSNVQGIAYLDPAHLWISGDYGAILFSNDGGITWDKQDSGITEDLLCTIRFVNKETAGHRASAAPLCIQPMAAQHGGGRKAARKDICLTCFFWTPSTAGP